MKKKVNILFISPNKWGRGITPIWIASHSGILKRAGHNVKLFDCTFYKNWSDDELNLNTKNSQFKSSEYENKIVFKSSNVYEDLALEIKKYKPDIIFWSALSSHIHGEGEYINIEYGYDLIKNLNTNALKVCGGVQATANSKLVLKRMPLIDYLISGESELVLKKLVDSYPSVENIKKIDGISYIDKKSNKIISNNKQSIISNLDILSPYDYSVFDEQIFLRPYNGEVVKAIDYELSRGCIYTCSYCVETIIQRYYDFGSYNQNGTLKNFKSYLRNKSAKKILKEIINLKKSKKINLIRCQDTNFLTINRKVLEELGNLFVKNNIHVKLYIETRAEGINKSSIELLKRLNVDGIGMGLELSDEQYRESALNRFTDQQKIINAFKLLKENNIKRTAYNIIGLPNQNEKSIINTIKFNSFLKPDVCSVAFYSKYEGTDLSTKAKKNFEKNPVGMDAQIRPKIINHEIPNNLLNFYKENFSTLVQNNLKNIEILKKSYNF